ncbi:hypothetical protein L914_14887 [Phytophthora nicotianae]|uniref:Uncharacterized protein n=1 Tax=Phytophthora nicotianae TaxID=4792 RepID=W2MTD8_PHYNI|nr:hypothetical protein L914_14887 [Phytophthora nicotianae]
MADGGRLACPEARRFTRLKNFGEAGGGYTFREWSFCRAAANNNITTTSPKVIIGRARNYVSDVRVLPSCLTFATIYKLIASRKPHKEHGIRVVLPI